MVKKIFALAGVSALAGAFTAVSLAGCSDDSTSTTTTQDSGVSDGSTKSDAKTPVGDDEEEEPAGTCMTKDTIDATKYPYTTVGATAGACTAKEAADLSAFFKAKVDANVDVKMSEWKASVGASCGTCVFSDGSGSTWTPIITAADDTLDFVNRGGCMEIQSGKEACGAAYQRVTTCALDACLKECTTQDEFDACRSDIQAIAKGPCKDAFTAFSTDCGANAGKFEEACGVGDWTFDGPILFQCVKGGAGDGGADGG